MITLPGKRYKGKFCTVKLIMALGTIENDHLQYNIITENDPVLL